MPDERRTYRDSDSGLEVTQLTDHRCHSHHFYFTNPGWYAGGRKLLVSSDRHNRTNLYGLDLATGAMEQLTDFAPVPLPREVEFLRACKNPLRDEVYTFHDRQLLAIDLVTTKVRVLAEIDPRWCVSMCNADADGKTVYFGMWEDQSHKFPVDLMRGYVGFGETWAAMPPSKVVAVPVAGGPMRVVFEENYWIGHVNTSPTIPGLLTYCHEGPWERIDHRVWGLDAATGRSWKIRPTAAGETVGHEYWFADGKRIGYHGTTAAGPMFGHCDHDGSNRVEVTCKGWTGHLFSRDENVIIGDGGNVIRLWRLIDGAYAAPQILCRHDSAMRIQATHPHPVISPDGKHVVFTSDRSGYGNVYQVALPDDLAALPLTRD